MTASQKPPSASLACLGMSYLSTGRAEPEDPLELVMECDGGPTGDCGWRVVLDQEPACKPDGVWDVSITSDTFLRLHEAHLAHRHAGSAR